MERIGLRTKEVYQQAVTPPQEGIFQPLENRAQKVPKAGKRIINPADYLLHQASKTLDPLLEGA